MQHASFQKALLLGASCTLAAASGAQTLADGSPKLSLPVACTPGKDCFVQQLMDHDPGPGARDYRCGSKVYDGHSGTDIRLPDLAAQRRGVAVLAAADGTVRGVRDGEPDSLKDDVGRAAIKGKECGNGVVLDHGAGWETQYCHLAAGSVAVRPGASVKRGQPLGRIGLSGDTQFPHLHLSVRRDGRTVDPFAPGLGANICSANASGTGMWTAEAAKALAYHATQIINLGFSDGPLAPDALDRGATTPATSLSPALVAYGRAIGLRAGDSLIVRLIGPGGAILAENRAAIDRPKAQYMLFTGKRRQQTGWPAGTYRALIIIEHQGAAPMSRAETLTFD